jgi:hypothetical protein
VTSACFPVGRRARERKRLASSGSGVPAAPAANFNPQPEGHSMPGLGLSSKFTRRSASERRRALQMLKLKARAGLSSAANGPSDEEVAAARVRHGLRVMDECAREISRLARADLADLAERRAELAKRRPPGTSRVITQEEALKLIAAKRQAAARPKRRTRARVGQREVF